MTRKWLAACMAMLLVGGISHSAEKPDAKESIKIEMVGVLKTGIMAIGGETTGNVITASGASFEVQPPKGVDPEKFEGKTVKIVGTLVQKEGVEIKLRRILVADKLQAAGDNDKEGIHVTITGKVRTGLVAPGGATTGTEIHAAGVTWELDLSKDKEFAALAEKHKDGLFVASGTLEVKKPMAAPPRPRWIVAVSTFKLAEGK